MGNQVSEETKKEKNDNPDEYITVRIGYLMKIFGLGQRNSHPTVSAVFQFTLSKNDISVFNVEGFETHISNIHIVPVPHAMFQGNGLGTFFEKYYKGQILAINYIYVSSEKTDDTIPNITKFIDIFIKAVIEKRKKEKHKIESHHNGWIYKNHATTHSPLLIYNDDLINFEAEASRQLTSLVADQQKEKRDFKNLRLVLQNLAMGLSQYEVGGNIKKPEINEYFF
jgi:hypothetical protein